MKNVFYSGLIFHGENNFWAQDKWCHLNQMATPRAREVELKTFINYSSLYRCNFLKEIKISKVIDYTIVINEEYIILFTKC